MNVLLFCDAAALTLRVLYCLKRFGARVHVVSPTPSSVRLSRYVSRYLERPSPTDDASLDAFARWIDEYSSKNAIDCLVPSGVPSSALLAKLKQRVTRARCFPVSGAETLKQLNNKWNLARLLHANGIPASRSELLASCEQLEQPTFQALEYPVVVKPLASESGRGVVKLESFEDLRRHVLGDGPFNALPLIVQDFIPGRDVGLSVLAQDGRVLAWTVQCWRSTVFGEGVLEFTRDEEALSIGERIIALTSYTGVAHFDMRRDQRSGAIVTFECNPRFWYSLPASMCQGVNFAAEGLRIAVGCGDGASVMSGYRTGTFYLNGEIGRRMPWRLGSLEGLSKENLAFFWQTVTDPFPNLRHSLEKLKRPRGWSRWNRRLLKFVNA